MATLTTRYYYPQQSKGMDTRTGQRNVSPDSNLLQAYRDREDATKYRQLKQQADIVDGSQYNPSLIPENHDFYKREYWDDATRADQRVVNNAAEANQYRTQRAAGENSYNYGFSNRQDPLEDKRFTNAARLAEIDNQTQAATRQQEISSNASIESARLLSEANKSNAALSAYSNLYSNYVAAKGDYKYW